MNPNNQISLFDNSFDPSSKEYQTDLTYSYQDFNSINELFRRCNHIKGSKKYIELLHFIRRFKKYSPYNNLLIYIQNPDVTYFATAHDWYVKFGRTIKDGARPMVILAPMTPILLVYDLSDTEGKRVPELLENPFETKGRLSQKRWDLTIKNMKNYGIRSVFVTSSELKAGQIERKITTGVAGEPVSYYTMTLNENLGMEAVYATIVHELAHLLLGHLGYYMTDKWPDRRYLCHRLMELEAESVTYLVCSRIGLETKSAEYLTGYFESDDDVSRINIDLIIKTAGSLEKIGQETIKNKSGNKN